MQKYVAQTVQIKFDTECARCKQSIRKGDIVEYAGYPDRFMLYYHLDCEER